ncbi:MAG: filamentous hemagglutinin N-terminal domain-containing protein, partial [Sterolibacteriaceae bacterium MAG5]|nr:filamentous hemagglutinin N-terminal domain-containing protein [Candidatus Nitricoxidireducens bremensis]
MTEFSSRRKSKDLLRVSQRRLLIAIAACFSPLAIANPTDPTVVSGSAVFQGGAGSLTITNSSGAIIDWKSFSIGAGEITRFVQSSASSQVLNRVTGGDPSVILGSLQSNGRVFLLNQNGVAFGAGAQVNVAGLVVSTLNLSNADFLAGKMDFLQQAGAGSIVNHGSLKAVNGGQIVLVAPTIENHGVIEAPNGDVILAAGKSANLVDLSRPEIEVELNAPANLALNVGQITGRNVGIFAGAIRHSGFVSANTAVLGENGRVVFKAVANTTVETGSRIEANGAAGGAITLQSGDTTIVSGTLEARGSTDKGGEIRVLGDKVGLFDGARVDASGHAGGGTALIGGNYQGTGSEQRASFTYVAKDASIAADALATGDGGKVVVWADDTTRYYGGISARGGATGGDGGFVEVSGKRGLVFEGAVVTSAPLGKAGNLLLDPTEITIQEGAAANNVSGTSPFSSTGGSSSIKWSTLANALNDNVVTVQTSSGDITLADGFDFSASAAVCTSGCTLKLDSAAGINASAGGLTVTGKANLSLWLNSAGATNLDTNLANFTDVKFETGAASAYSGVISGTGSLTKEGAGTLTLSGNNTYDGVTNVNAGTLSVTHANGLGGTGAGTVVGAS